MRADVEAEPRAWRVGRMQAASGGEVGVPAEGDDRPAQVDNVPADRFLLWLRERRRGEKQDERQEQER